MTKLLKTTGIITASILLAACNSGGGGGGSSDPNDIPGRDNTGVAVYDFDGIRIGKYSNACQDAPSVFATDNLYANISWEVAPGNQNPDGTINHDGKQHDVDDNVVKNILRAAQLSLEVLASDHNMNIVNDFNMGIADDEKLEICIVPPLGQHALATRNYFEIGTGRTNKNLDNILDHEFVHVTNYRVAKHPLSAEAWELWLLEGVATYFENRAQVSRDTMLRFTNTGFLPTDIISLWEAHLYRMAGGDQSIEYSSYSSVFAYLEHMGSTNEDVWNYFKLLGELETNCRLTQYEAHHNGYTDRETGKYFPPFTVGESYDYSERYDMTGMFCVNEDDEGYNDPSKENASVLTWVYDPSVGKEIAVGANNHSEIAFNQAFYEKTGVSYMEIRNKEFFSRNITNGFL
ncbi:hypothetical protein [Vibrio agarivorans]|uniref:hypothetical protein n=1 Tax=Vibrio agarivorans TaxID=153622 RepID=UPI00223044B9|nr:hypothetical protein [Vibrio agarivorans]